MTFPAVCGRICNRRCEDACTRGTIDQAVAIDAVKKFIAQQDLNAESRYVPPVVQPSLQGLWKQKIAIIGGGPAGLSCAYFLALQGYKPTVFEKNPHPGGMLRYGIPSFKLEKDVIDAEIEILKELGVEIRCGVEVGKEVTLADLRADGYKAFYLAIGCQGGRKAGVPGEEAAGIQTAVNLLHTVGDDENYKMSGRTVVIGGGNVAIDAARVSLRCGADAVTMVCLEPRDGMPASAEEIAEAEEEGTAIRCGYGPKEFVTENGHVTAVVLKKCTGLYNPEGRFAPTYDENDAITLPCDNVVLSIGQCIEWGDLLDGEAVELGRGQGAVADPVTYQTDQPDVFVGGDVYTGPRFAIDAIAAGKQGAVSIHRFVQPNTSMTIGRNRREFFELDKGNLSIGEYDHTPRQQAAVDEHIDAHRSFRDAHLTLTETQVRAETARCLGCGASVVDPNKCIGCGVCTTKCEFVFSLLVATRSRIFLLSSMMGPLRRASSEAMEMLSATLSTPMMPVARRSSVSRATLFRMASRGCLMVTSSPLIHTLPEVWARRPKMPSISSVRWAPTRPATPRISPFFSSKLQWRKERGWMEVKSSTFIITSSEG